MSFTFKQTGRRLWRILWRVLLAACLLLLLTAAVKTGLFRQECSIYQRCADAVNMVIGDNTGCINRRILFKYRIIISDQRRRRTMGLTVAT